MSVELGHFALILALLAALAQMVLAWRAHFYAPASEAVAAAIAMAARVQCGLVALAFLALSAAFIRSDFSVALVAAHSHIAKPLIYKIAGLWGNHEGSMLLWVLILAAYGMALSFYRRDRAGLRAYILGVQGALSAAFLLFLLLTSNPFARLLPAPFEGRGLNPILQDPALAAHPPLLYIGYVGFASGFAFALAALARGKADAAWARMVRPWIIWSWGFLTLGIALGSYWAYYELGWGGFWFWDPVENASLMPWLSGTALLHALTVTARRGALIRWSLLLAILTFGLSLIGAFLVRSGVLTSVHSFANDPSRGVFILLILTLFIGGALAYYGRMSARLSVAPPVVTGREGALILNNVFFATATATVFLGTLYPLAIDALGLGKISVGAPYFNSTLIPLALLLIVVLPPASLLSWQGGRPDWRALRAPLIAALAVCVLTYWTGGVLHAALAMGGACWLIGGALVDIARRARSGGAGRRKLSMGNFAAACAHAGFGVMVLGIAGASGWRAEQVVAAKSGDVLRIAHIELRYEGTRQIDGANYRAEQGRLRILGGDDYLRPQRRFYHAERGQTTEAAIAPRLGGNLYAVLGDEVGKARIIRLWYHPLVSFIWLGGLLMALGAVCALRRRAA